MNQPLDPRVQENNELQNQVQFNDDDEKKLCSNEQQNNNLSEGPKEYQTNIPMTENTNGNNISEKLENYFIHGIYYHISDNLKEAVAIMYTSEIMSRIQLES